MVLRFAPPDQVGPAFAWLLAQQAEDGGWGEPEALPLARTVPTLAAVLAAHQRPTCPAALRAVTAGCSWLERTGRLLLEPLPDDVPVGMELLLRPLLLDLQQTGLRLDIAPYAPLLELGERRRRRLSALPHARLATTTALHSYEALDLEAGSALFHPRNGVGCSPAATAVWLSRCSSVSEREAALAFLARAAAATGLGLPGVVPTAFPITRFVQAYSLHTLAQVGLLRHPALSDVISPHLDELASLVAEGVGCSDGFPPDGDDTAAALGALVADERPVDLRPLLRFAVSDHFASYLGELQPSVITTARATHVLVAAGEQAAPYRAWIALRQQPDGRWESDKWNGHWLYATWQAVLALRDDCRYGEALQRAEQAILAAQNPDGGWGVRASTPEATAYGILVLAALPRHNEVNVAAIRRARSLLIEAYQPAQLPRERHWLAKDRYAPFRLSHITVLAALLSTE
jgi:hypothetical protein